MHPLAQKDMIRSIGLMTGTSMDGLDISVVDIVSHQYKLSPQNIISDTIPFPAQLRKSICETVSGGEELYAKLDEDLGKWMAEVVSSFVDENNITGIDLIGSHGQTVHHENGVKSVQLGNPEFLHRALGVPVIYDFRTADIGAGGTGAPLIPKVDEWLFQKAESAVIALNIGGIANVSLVPPKNKGEIVGFDTGPGMALLDEVYRSHFIEGFDGSGKAASQGMIDMALVNAWMEDAYFKMAPPKSTGRDYFGPSWVTAHNEELNNISFEDRLASLSLFTAKTIHESCKSFLEREDVSELIMGGGGSHHGQIFFHLERLFQAVQVKRSDEYGVSIDEKEAVGFSLLAVANIKEIPGNIPSVTGAKEAVVLGEIYPAEQSIEA